jgi:hypothetical protein
MILPIDGTTTTSTRPLFKKIAPGHPRHVSRRNRTSPVATRGATAGESATTGGLIPAISLTCVKNARFRSVLMFQFTGGH